MVKGGESWQLAPDEKAHIKRINEEHMQIDPIEELILEKYRWDEFQIVAEWKTATQIGQDIGLKNITARETRLISGVVNKLNGNQNKRSGSGRYLMVAALKHY